MNEQVHDQGAELTWEERAERILGQAAALLAQRGDEEAVALLVDVRSVIIDMTSEVARTERVYIPDIEDGLWGTETVYLQEAILDVDDHLVSRFTEEVCQRIAETLSYVAERNGVWDVVVRPGAPGAAGGRRRLAHLLCRPAGQRSPEQSGAPRIGSRRAPGGGRPDVRQRRGTAGLPGA